MDAAHNNKYLLSDIFYGITWIYVLTAILNFYQKKYLHSIIIFRAILSEIK